MVMRVHGNGHWFGITHVRVHEKVLNLVVLIKVENVVLSLEFAT